MQLSALEQHWNNQTLNYNLEKYNWPQWALSVVQEIAPQVSALETLHKTLTASEIEKVSRHVQNACSRKDFMERFDDFVASFVPEKIDNRKYMIQRQGTLRVVIPDQQHVGRRLAFHQGIFVGNGRGCRTIWTPFTEAKGTNTMWMVDIEKSREITKQIIKEKWPLEKIESECLKHAFPIELKPGQSHLFLQEMLHGNVNNQEGYTRVSMDMRILIEGEEFGRRYPGGFMRFPGDHQADVSHDYTDKFAISYSGWNSEYSKHIPRPYQKGIIDQYCEKFNINYTSYEFENEHCDWMPGLEYYIKQKPDLIVCESMYGLPDDAPRRIVILETAVQLGVELHFANEYFTVKCHDDINKLESYRNFAVRKKNNHVWE